MRADAAFGDGFSSSVRRDISATDFFKDRSSLVEEVSNDPTKRIAAQARTDELLGRWLELSAIADPWLRSHPSNGDGHVPQPWSSPENAARTRTAVALHSALASYKRNLVAVAASGGPPMVRHTYFNCPADALDAAALDRLGGTQLLLGDDVLVAPALAPGVASVAVVVPPACSRGRARSDDAWVDIWAPAGRPLRPLENVTVAAKLGRPALLARNGTAAAAALVAAARALAPGPN